MAEAHTQPWRFCGFCGLRVTRLWRYCPYSGHRLHGPRPLSEPPSPAEEELDSTGANSDAGKGPGLSDEQLDLEEKTAKKAKTSEGNHPQGSQT